MRVEASSVLLTQDGARYRLPRSRAGYEEAAGDAPDRPRAIREVVTERFLLNAAGSFYVLPRPTAGGAARIKPVCTHDKRVTDFCSWRGLTVLAGTRADAKPDGHYFAAAPESGNQGGGPGLWFGDIDDLWRLGKPRGRGGPWTGTAVRPDEPSDPYLMAGYDRKSLELSHDAPQRRPRHARSGLPGRRLLAPLPHVRGAGGTDPPVRVPRGLRRPLAADEVRHRVPGNGTTPLRVREAQWRRRQDVRVRPGGTPARLPFSASEPPRVGDAGRPLAFGGGSHRQTLSNLARLRRQTQAAVVPDAFGVNPGRGIPDG